MIKRIIAVLSVISMLIGTLPVVFAEEAKVQNLPEANLFSFDYLKYPAEEAFGENCDVIENENAEEGKAVCVRENGSLSFSILGTRALIGKLWARVHTDNGKKINFKISVKGEEKSINHTFKGSDWQWIMLSNEIISSAGGEKIDVKLSSKGEFEIDSFVISTRKNFIPGNNDVIYPIIDRLNEYFPIGRYSTVPYTPRKDHPRLLINKEFIPKIKENMQKEQNLFAYNSFLSYLDNETDGYLQSNGNNDNMDAKVLQTIEAYAFQSVLYNDEEYALKAKKAILNYVKTVVPVTIGTNPERKCGDVLYIASLVYDWTYDYWTDAEREELMASMLSVAKLIVDYSDFLNRDTTASGTWSQGFYGSHAGEGVNLRDFLSVGIAFYDEYPQIYDYVAAMLYREYKPARDYLNTSHTFFQGTSYGLYRPFFDGIALILMERATGEKIWSDDYGQTFYDYLYAFRSDDKRFREGDDTIEEYASKAETTGTVHIATLISSYYKDPYIKGEFFKANKGGERLTFDSYGITPVSYMILNDPDVAPADLYTLPESRYFPSPSGKIVAKTGWNRGVNSPDVSVYMKIGEEYTANHAHLDSGSFQIYYKGLLSGDEGIYAGYGTNNDKNWSKETISHNGLLIYDPEEKTNYATINSGGQIRRDNLVRSYDDMISSYSDCAKVIGWEIDPKNPIEPEYSYISGDLTPGYSSKKVDEVRRSMIFMPTDDKVNPGVFIVMDKINAVKPEYKKTFLLHTKVEPVKVEGNTTIIERTDVGYNGRLTVKTLYPKNPVLTTIGGPGRQWEINGVNITPAGNYDPSTVNEILTSGWGRIEISPSVEQKEDYFLNAMYVSDADSERDTIEPDLIETELVLGTKLLDKVAVFSKNQERISNKFSFEFNSEEECDIAVTGIKAGKWDIYHNDKKIGTEISYEEGGIIYFSSKGGNITLVPNGASNEKRPEAVIWTEPSDERKVIVYINGSPWYSEVDSVLDNGRVLVSEEMLENIEIDTEYNPETGKITLSKKKIKLEMEVDKTEVIKTVAKEAPKTIRSDIAPEIINGNVMIPLRFAVEETNGTVTWDKYSMTATVTAPTSLVAASDEVSIVDATWTHATTTGFRAFDGDFSTRWAADVTTGPQQLVMQFDDTYEVNKARISFYKTVTNGYDYEFYLSEDGENWILLAKGLTEIGGGDNQEYIPEKPIKAKYAKLVGFPRSNFQYITINEIMFWHTIEEEE